MLNRWSIPSVQLLVPLVYGGHRNMIGERASMETSQSRPAASTALDAEAARSLPLHQQVNDALHRRIVSGELAVGGRLPSERALSREFAVSRVNVRQALTHRPREGPALRNSTVIAR